jgi:hypothetical protein
LFGIGLAGGGDDAQPDFVMSDEDFLKLLARFKATNDPALMDRRSAEIERVIFQGLSGITGIHRPML